MFVYVNLLFCKHQLFHPERFGGLIFTSPRSVQAVKMCLEKHRQREFVSVFDSNVTVETL